MDLLLTTGPNRWDNFDRDRSTFFVGRFEGILSGIDDINQIVYFCNKRRNKS